MNDEITPRGLGHLDEDAAKREDALELVLSNISFTSIHREYRAERPMNTEDEIISMISTEATETIAASKVAPAPSSAFPSLEDAVLEYLDSLGEKERVERIDDLLHRLNFERRLALLTPNQREAMNDRTLRRTGQ